MFSLVEWWDEFAEVRGIQGRCSFRDTKGLKLYNEVWRCKTESGGILSQVGSEET